MASWINTRQRRAPFVDNKQLRTLINRAPFGIAMFDKNMRYLAVSDRFLNEYRVSLSGILGKSHYEIFPEITEHWKAIHRRCLAGATEKNDAVEFLRADGTIDYLKWEIVPWYETEQKIGGILLFSEIVSDRKRADDALRESEERFQKVFHSSPMAQSIATLPDGRWIDVNDSFLRLIEFTREEVIGRTATELAILDAETLALGLIANEDLDYELRIQTKSGKLKYVFATQHKIKIGGREHLVSSLLDHTERTNVEMALILSEQRFRTALAKSPIVVFNQDQNLQYTWIHNPNPGFSAEGVLGKTDAELLPEADAARLTAIKRRVIASGTAANEEVSITIGGQQFFYDLTVEPLRDETSNIIGVTCVSIDVTSRKKTEEALHVAIIRLEETDRLKKAEETLNIANMKLEEADQRKNEFMATLSHELRTPLSSIIMAAQMLQQKLVAPERFDEVITSIEKNAIAQNQLIEDLLDISRIISGKIVLEISDFDLNDIVQQAIAAVTSVASTKSQTLEYCLDPSIGVIACDAIRIKQVVWNLINNAIKFSKPGTTITIRTSKEWEEVKIQIIDQGKGINAKFLPHIFKRFSQEDSSKTRAFGGLGLGLSIVHDLVKQHGGKVSAESPGEELGATFTVTLPWRRASPSPVNSHETALVRTLAHDDSLSGIRILVVDDSVDSLALVEMFLQKLGADVRTAESAKAGLGLVQKFRPDILLSDISMPDEDGISFLRKIRKLPKEMGGDTPAIAMTAYASQKDVQMVTTAGFQAHLPKPIEIKKLSALIASVRTTHNA